MTAEPTPALDLDAVEARLTVIERWLGAPTPDENPAVLYVRALLPAARRTLECWCDGAGRNKYGVPCGYCAPDREALRAIVEEGGS